MGGIIKFEKPLEYWLCTGSLDKIHDKDCMERRMGHGYRCRYGTAKEHSQAGKDGLLDAVQYFSLDK